MTLRDLQTKKTWEYLSRFLTRFDGYLRLEMRERRRLSDERIRFLEQGDDADPHGRQTLRAGEDG